MAAENMTDSMSSTNAASCFNEAAAHGRGKPGFGSPEPAGSSSFNEAAAHGRGKRGTSPAPRVTAGCFNEAAAHGRGKLIRWT